MSKAHIHAASSVRRWGGEAADYLPIHLFMDSSKAALADNRHRALTHNAWFIREVIPRVFGDTFTNSADKVVSTIDVAEQHVIEDYKGFIPSAQDFLAEMELKPWMQNGEGAPPSMARVLRTQKNPKYALVD